MSKIAADLPTLLLTDDKLPASIRYSHKLDTDHLDRSRVVDTHNTQCLDACFPLAVGEEQVWLWFG